MQRMHNVAACTMFARMQTSYDVIVDVNVCTHVPHVAVFHAHAFKITEWICAAHAASILRNCSWQCHADGRDHHLLPEIKPAAAEVWHAVDGLSGLPLCFEI